MKTAKAIISIILALLFISSISVCAFAETYDLANGAITVNGEADGQYVSQDKGVQNEKQTTETIITQSSNSIPTDNQIVINANTGNVNVTIKDINIENNIDAKKDAIDIYVTGGNADILLENVKIDNGPIFVSGEENTDVCLTFSGSNELTTSNDDLLDSSPITIIGVGTAVIQGADSDAGLNIEGSGDSGGFSGITVGEDEQAVSLEIKDINLNISEASVGIAGSIDNLEIDNSNINLDCKDAAVALATNLDESNISISNCRISGNDSLSFEKVQVEVLKELYVDFYTLLNQNGEIVNKLSIERLPSGYSKLQKYADALNVREGRTFCFNHEEKDLLSVSCNGKVLVKGTDYEVSSDNGMTTVTFTDAFFAANGDGPLSVVIDFIGATYYLSAVNK